MKKTVLISLLLVVACGYSPMVRTFVRTTPLIQDNVEPVFFRVQVFAMYDRKAAVRRARELKVLQDDPVMVVFKDPNWKVVVGNFTNRGQALKVKNELINLGYIDAWVTTIKESELVPEKKHIF